MSLIGSVFGSTSALASANLAGRYDPLIQVLIKKGIPSVEEASQIQKEAMALEQKQRQELARKIEGNATPEALKGLKFQMLAFLDYSVGENTGSHEGQKSYDRFQIKHGYFRVTKKMTSSLGGHLT